MIRKTALEIGDIEVKKTISINALQNPDRSFTKLIFIDAVEPKNDPKFPDLIDLNYTIQQNLKKIMQNKKMIRLQLK